jgi:hypothetical protein
VADVKILRMKEKRTTRVRDLPEQYHPVVDHTDGQAVPRVILSEKDGVQHISADILLLEALGTTDPDFLDGILRQLANAGSRGGKVDEQGLNFMLSVVKRVKPRDQVEALLAAQMAAVHAATMTFALRLGPRLAGTGGNCIFRHQQGCDVGAERSSLARWQTLMRARAQATVRVRKKRPELLAHSRCHNRTGCGLPVATGVVS